MTDAPEIEPLPPMPKNSCILTVRPGPDKVHTLLRAVFDVTELGSDQQKLMTFMIGQAIEQIAKAVNGMNRIEAAKQLALRERISEFKGNGEPPPE